MKSAVAISPATPSNAITDKLGNSVDMILVMTVVPGKWFEIAPSAALI
jgi:ribulose-phosphate 3-epimerase